MKQLRSRTLRAMSLGVRAVPGRAANAAFVLLQFRTRHLAHTIRNPETGTPILLANENVQKSGQLTCDWCSNSRSRLSRGNTRTTACCLHRRCDGRRLVAAFSARNPERRSQANKPPIHPCSLLSPESGERRHDRHFQHLQ